MYVCAISTACLHSYRTRHNRQFIITYILYYSTLLLYTDNTIIEDTYT